MQLMGLGAAFLIVPGFVNAPLLQPVLGQLRPLGGVMLLAGGLLFWLMHKRPALAAVPQEESARPAVPSAPARAARVSAVSTPNAQTSPPKAADTPQAPRTLGEQPMPVPTAWSAEVFDVIEWRRFEAVVEHLFQQAGFETQAQSHGADGGVDIWLHSRHQPGKAVSVVQCKHWQGKRVGVDKVRELRGVMAAHAVARGQFASTAGFTSEAIAFARENSINPLDRAALLNLIATRTPEQQAALLATALAGDYWRPTCVNCGTKLLARTPRKGGAPFWGCASYPQCKTTMAMRSGAD